MLKNLWYAVEFSTPMGARIAHCDHLVIARLARHDEVHVKSDHVQIAYRKLRKRCLDKGWAIEPSATGSEVRSV
jgi:hypothetical protein